MKRFIPLFLFTVLVIHTNGELRMSLNSKRLDGSWIVWNQNKSIQAPVKVPGGIYSDLQTAGVLSDNLFYRFNDLDYRWVARDNWTYQRSFDLSSDFMNKTAINLVFHGIDTIGEIYLNGRLLASVDNMFVRYVLPIKSIAKAKNNTLQVRLKSPIHEANRLAEIQKRKYPVPPECTPSYYNGECHVNFLRKMQASFAWDWGPAFPSVGIWKSVEVEAFDTAVLRDVALSTQKINDSVWRINIKAYLEYADEYKPNTSSILSSYLSSDDDTREANEVETVIEDMVKDPSVRNGYISSGHIYAGSDYYSEWWPNGYGEQNLRTYTVVYKNGAEESSKDIKFAFREIELVQEELQPGKDGLSFYFKVNGVPIFAKGSNWIPGHILPELSYDKSMIRYMLQSVKDANMNMLRVWGGGLYESDAFYRIADELGILIWQDMTFACSMYPTDQKFIESVKKEVEQQVRRLQHHPSIAVWAGNNENEAALVGNWYGTSKNFSLYKSDYVKLYVDTIKPVVLENDISRSYLISSPTNGIKTDEEGYVAKNPYSEFYGDTHYYNYIFDGWTDFIYPDTRFASEYGFQSMPSFKSMSQVTLPEDRKLESEFSKKRQHLLVGNDFILGQIQRQLPLPKNDDSEQFYKTYIYYSQISQAMSTKTETEKYRRDRSKLTADNKGNTMGAMYWQLNDVWQAPSWSSIEFGGKWKMLHYFAKKFFSPVLVSSEKTRDGVLKVYLISDLLEDVHNVSLKVSVYSWDNFTPRKVHSNNVVLKKASSKVHATYELSSLLNEAGCKKQNCFIYLSVQGPDIFSDNVVYPSTIYEIENLRKPKFTVSFDKGSESSSKVRLRITTDRIAPFVWLETDEPGEFSDNGFMLLNKEIVLTFTNRQKRPVNFDKFKSTFNVRSVL